MGGTHFVNPCTVEKIFIANKNGDLKQLKKARTILDSPWDGGTSKIRFSIIRWPRMGLFCEIPGTRFD